MRIFKFKNSGAMKTWLHQNKAECIDSAEGCLLDNLVMTCKNGIAFLWETYVNPNMSEYTIEFFRNNEDCNAQWDRLYSLQNEMEV